MLETLRQWRVWLSMFLFFVYMGIEVAFGSWAYTLLTESRGVSPRLAGFFMASYWGIFTVGRIVAGFYTRRVSERTLVVGSLVVGLAGTVLLALGIPGMVNLIASAVIGLALAPVLAALLSGTAGRVGERYTPNAIGIQIAAMGVGGAAGPSLAGVVAAAAVARRDSLVSHGAHRGDDRGLSVLAREGGEGFLRPTPRPPVAPGSSLNPHPAAPVNA